jgi:hypothetical protein
MNPKEILELAKENATQRLELIRQTQEYFKHTSTELDELVSKLDASFLKKLYNFPGDLSTHRIAKIMERLVSTNNLQEKLERLTGKKVTFKEGQINVTKELDPEYQKRKKELTDNFKEAVLDVINEYINLDLSPAVIGGILGELGNHFDLGTRKNKFSE